MTYWCVVNHSEEMVPHDSAATAQARAEGNLIVTDHVR